MPYSADGRMGRKITTGIKKIEKKIGILKDKLKATDGLIDIIRRTPQRKGARPGAIGLRGLKGVMTAKRIEQKKASIEKGIKKLEIKLAGFKARK